MKTRLLPYWRDALNKGKAKKKITNRWYRRIELALINLRIRYWKTPSFWNPYHHGLDGSLIAGLQWIEFLVELPNKKVGAIYVNSGWGFGSGPHKYHLRYMETKKRFLSEHGTESIWLDKAHGYQEHMILISRWYNNQKNTPPNPVNRELRKIRRKSKIGRIFKKEKRNE
jgi:hypothetical protein